MFDYFMHALPGHEGLCVHCILVSLGASVHDTNEGKKTTFCVNIFCFYYS